jgi:hypothetical protein
VLRMPFIERCQNRELSVKYDIDEGPGKHTLCRHRTAGRMTMESEVHSLQEDTSCKPKVS